MFTLKLYKNGPLSPHGLIEILEVAGVWVHFCHNDVKKIVAFKKKLGVQDEDGGHEFWVGGNPMPEQDAISTGVGGNHYTWAVLENAQGKTTEMIR